MARQPVSGRRPAVPRPPRPSNRPPAIIFGPRGRRRAVSLRPEMSRRAFTISRCAPPDWGVFASISSLASYKIQSSVVRCTYPRRIPTALHTGVKRVSLRVDAVRYYNFYRLPFLNTFPCRTRRADWRSRFTFIIYFFTLFTFFIFFFPCRRPQTFYRRFPVRSARVFAHRFAPTRRIFSPPNQCHPDMWHEGHNYYQNNYPHPRGRRNLQSLR